MSDLEAIKKLMAECSVEEQRALKQFFSELVPHPLEREWGIDAETILTAIRRSSDLTKRGVRGIIAEAVFESAVIPTVAASGWQPATLTGNLSYDVRLENGRWAARIQIKLQRLEKAVPKLYYPDHYEEGSLYVVEVQRTRGGRKKTKRPFPGTGTTLETIDDVEETRPYRFGDFDILAVNMHPSSGNWKNFRYTIASWLLPRAEDHALIEILQPVAAVPNDVWTDNLWICLDWYASGEKRSVLNEILHHPRSRARRGADVES
jgi:hypothetical protein